MTIHDVIQRSPEWRALRAGRLCGSDAADAFKTNKDGKFAASRRNIAMQLVLERITGRVQESGFVTQAMQDGIDREDAARALYCAVTDTTVRFCGFASHDELRAGCSPDGVVGDIDGIVEIKCPIPATHWSFVKSGLIPEEYVKQCVHNMWITGAEWCDYVSYNPDFPEQLQLRVKRINRDATVMADYEAAVRKFLAEVDVEVAAIHTMVDSADQWRKSMEATA
jgi:hypothetical protein